MTLGPSKLTFEAGDVMRVISKEEGDVCWMGREGEEVWKWKCSRDNNFFFLLLNFYDFNQT
jgi:hypothetical protein